MAVGTIFPPTGVKEDSQFFNISRDDVTLETKTDGGYIYSRPRNARPASRIITTGFTELNQTQFQLMDDFIVTYGRFKIFSYKIPTTGESISVRFKSVPKFNYVGMGGTHRYTVSGVELIEV